MRRNRKDTITEVISDTNIGGAGILLSSIVGSLADEFNFEIILPRGSELYSRLPRGVKITELQISKDESFSPRDILTFAKHLAATRPTVLHSHASLTSRIAARLTSVPVLISTRHCSRTDRELIKRSYLRSFAYRLFTDITVSTADRATEDLILEGVPKNRIITIKNGSPDLKKRITGMDMSVYDELEIPKDAIILGSVARLERVKGQDVILRAAREIVKRFPNVYFLFAGDGKEKENYRKLSSKLGVDNRAIFIGYTPHPERYQSVFYINLNASRGTETSCLATSEAMSLGIPTVASDFGGNCEMIQSGINGFTFPKDNHYAMADRIADILSSKKLHEALSYGARLTYEEKFSLDAMADSYRNLYSSLLSCGKTAEKRRLIGY